MNTTLLGILGFIYLLGLVLLRRQRQGLIGYLWGSFGLAGLLVLLAQHGEWNIAVGELQAGVVAIVAGWLGVVLTFIEPASLAIPDPTGWSVLRIGIECSTLIEASVFTGLILFYPRFSPQERSLRWIVGVGATFLVNFIRLGVIIAIVMTLGKPAVPWAHAVVARLVFFVGIVIVYWHMLTLPTLKVIRRDIEVSGRAVT